MATGFPSVSGRDLSHRRARAKYSRGISTSSNGNDRMPKYASASAA